jgi:lipopolysaccharide heptosyltransferase I
MINGVPRILLVRLSAIGDVVRVLPALHGLRETFPNAQIDWVVERRSADLLEGHPDLDSVLVFDRSAEWKRAAKAFWALCNQVRGNRYDIAVDFHGIFKSGVIVAFSGAAERRGFARPRSREVSYLFTNKKVRLPSPHLNRIEENLLLVESLGVRNPGMNATIHVPQEVRDEVDEFFEQTFDSGKWVVAMHAPVERPEKQWPFEYFAQLADLLLADGRFEVLLTWGPGQFEQAARVAAKARRNPLIAPEMPTLKHYAWLAHHADLYFGGDTGPTHIASAMGTPVVVVFGGTDPAKHAPCRKPFETLYVPPEAPKDETRKTLSVEERMRRITPEMAYDACIRLTAARKRLE